MKKLRDELLDLIHANSFLEFGFFHRLYNLSQLAKFLKPYIEIRAKKEITETSLVMALSRLQSALAEPSTQKFQAKHISVRTGLVILTYENTSVITDTLFQMSHTIQKEGYLTFTRGTDDITVICDQHFEAMIRSRIPYSPKSYFQHVAGIGISFDEKYLEIPGYLHTVLQMLLMQNINILEVASTHTEIIVYLHSDDSKLGFDTLHEMLAV